MRVTPQPLTSPGPYQAGAQAISQAGAAIGQVGQTVAQLAFAQQAAENKSAIAIRTQTGLQQLDTRIEELNQQALIPDPETGEQPLLNPLARGNRSNEIGKEIMGELGQTLQPRQRMLFEADFGQFLTARTAAVRHRAQVESVHAMDQTADNGVKFHTQGALNAEDPVQAGLHLINARRIAEDAVQTGVWTSAKRDLALSQATEAVQLNAAQVALRSAPGQAVLDMQALRTGKPAVLEPLNALPPSLWNKVSDEALTELTKTVHVRESADASVKRQLTDRQSLQASQYRAVLYKPGVTIPELLSMVAPINDDRTAQRLGENDHRELLLHIQTLMDKLREDSYKDRDVPVIAQQAGILVETADTPAALDQAQQWVLNQTTSLSSTTTQRMLARLSERGDRNDPLNDEAVKEGKRLFLSGAFPAGMVPALMEKIEPTIQAKTSIGIDVYTKEMRRIYESEGRAAMRAQASEVGRRLKDLYFPEALQATGAPVGLPPAFEGVRTLEDGLIVLDSLELPQAAKRTLYLQLKQSLPKRTDALPAPKPTLPNPGRARTPGTPK